MATGTGVVSGRQSLRGELVRQFACSSLVYSARQAGDLPALLPRALSWYRRLVDLGVTVQFQVVCDLGYLLLEGEDFRFRSFFADAALEPHEREVREAFETRVLVRRLQEAKFSQLRRLILDNRAPDLALVRALELLLRPAAARLSHRFVIEDLQSLPSELLLGDLTAERDAFEGAVGAPGVLLRLLGELASAGPSMDLDRLLQAEDFYEIEHIRVFPRESLREVARRIKTVERWLGPARQATSRTLRERALAETALESVGTYPTGGIAELTTTGPVENLVASELIYLEPDEPIDPFLVRFAENELLKYLRDSAVLRMMRRTVWFLVEDCPEFACPVTTGLELYGTKVIRCLLGLVLGLTGDLLRIFRRDDVAFHLSLLAPAGGGEAGAERHEIVEVLHLLLREKEEQGTVLVDVCEQSLVQELTAMPVETQRSRTLVVVARPERLAELAGLRLRGETRLVPVAVQLRDTEPVAGAVTINLAGQPLAALLQAKERILGQVIG